MKNAETPKAEKLARALSGFMSGERALTKQLAAQSRDELRRLSERNAEFEDALNAVEKWWLGDGANYCPGAPACIFQVRSVLAAKP